jgi:hypothetical protein
MDSLGKIPNFDVEGMSNIVEQTLERKSVYPPTDKLLTSLMWTAVGNRYATRDMVDVSSFSFYRKRN